MRYFESDPRVESYVCFDNSLAVLAAAGRYVGAKGVIWRGDAKNAEELLSFFRVGNFSGVLNALPYSLLPATTGVCVNAGLSMADLGGNDEVRKKQQLMGGAAVRAGATIAPACGLAPGLISDLAFSAKNYLTGIYSIKMFCGGLPQKPEGDLRHALFLMKRVYITNTPRNPSLFKMA
jgi:saccharopine dehydrogenase-like NADP-dependent oxidoreductase